MHTFLLEDFKERRSLERCQALTSEIVNRLLWFLHPRNVVGKRRLFIERFSRVEAKKFGKNITVLAVFMNTKLEIFGESFIESYSLVAFQGIG